MFLNYTAFGCSFLTLQNREKMTQAVHLSLWRSNIDGPNSASDLLCDVITGGQESVPNGVRNIVDVRDVAAAVLLAYEKPEAEGRYICTSYCIKTQDLVENLKSLYPNYTYPHR